MKSFFYKVLVIVVAHIFLNAQANHDIFGYYMGGQYYYNFGSSYYYNPGMDYYWDGQGWIFDTGFKIRTDDDGNLITKCATSNDRINWCPFRCKL